MLPRKRLPLDDCCGRECERQALQGAHAPIEPRRGWEFAAGALSIGLWALMPKCLACLAMHMALWTGLGLSLGAATCLRGSLLCLSGVLLCYVAWIALKRTRRGLAAMR